MRTARLIALLALLPTALFAQSPKTRPDPKRQEAVASLRAVNIVVSNGGTLEDFRKYYLEAAIKVGALPDTKANRPIKEIAALYAGAASQISTASTGMDGGTEQERIKLSGMTGVGREMAQIDFDEHRAANARNAKKSIALLCDEARIALARLK